MLKTYVSEKLEQLNNEGVLNNFHQKDLAKQLGVAVKTIKLHLERLNITHEKNVPKNYILTVLKEETLKTPFLTAEEIKGFLEVKDIKKTIIHIRQELVKLVKTQEIFKQAKGKINFFTLDKNLLLNDYIDFYKYAPNLKYSKEDNELIIELAKTQNIREIYETLNHRIEKNSIYHILKKNNIKEFIRFKSNDDRILEKINTLPKDDKGIFLISYRQASILLKICPKYLVRVAKKNGLIFKGYKKRNSSTRIYKVKDPSLKIVKEKVSPLPRPKKQDPAKAAMEVKIQEAKKIEKELIKKESSSLGFCDFSVRNPSCLNRTSREKIEVFASGGRNLCKNCMTKVGV